MYKPEVPNFMEEPSQKIPRLSHLTTSEMSEPVVEKAKLHNVLEIPNKAQHYLALKGNYEHHRGRLIGRRQVRSPEPDDPIVEKDLFPRTSRKGYEQT